MRRVPAFRSGAPLRLPTGYRLLPTSFHPLKVPRKQRAVAVFGEADAEEEAGVGLPVLAFFEALVADGRAVEAGALFAELEREAERDAFADEVTAADVDGGEDDAEAAVANVVRVAGDAAGGRRARRRVEQRDEDP